MCPDIVNPLPQPRSSDAWPCIMAGTAGANSFGVKLRRFSDHLTEYIVDLCSIAGELQDGGNSSVQTWPRERTVSARVELKVATMPATAIGNCA